MARDSLQNGVIAWFAGNSVAANLLMLSIIVLGILSVADLRKEAFPSRPADTVTVSVNYDSGDPQMSEEGIALKVEEALETVAGIKRITSVSSADGSTIDIEMDSEYDLDALLRDVKSQVDAINNFPSEAEKPVIEKQQRLNHAYAIKLYGDTDRATLQSLAERMKVDLLAQPDITNLSIKGKAEPMISIEVDETSLQAYGLTLSDVDTAINAESSTSITSSLRSEGKVVRLKASEQAYQRKQFEAIPLITTESGAIVRLGDVARIEDTFTDDALVISRYNGSNGIGIEIKVDEKGDVIKIVEQVDEVVKNWQAKTLLPENVTVETWHDGSEMIVDRLSMLIKNALTGMLLVFVMLALFLNLRVALWVTAGLPFIFAGTLFFMSDNFIGMSINEMTTFGFILALGIVVDDAVVVGESIYTTRRNEGDKLQSTIKGTLQVAVPTIFGVLTTVATFIALSNVAGGMGHVYSQFATVVTICLLLSVVESKLILPAHMAHLNTHRSIGTQWRDTWARIQHAADSGLSWVNRRLYYPAIRFVLIYRYAVVMLFVALAVLVIAMPFKGLVRVAFFPSIPGSSIEANLSMQSDASFGLTQQNLLYLERTAQAADAELVDEYGYQSSAVDTLEVVASNDYTGSVTVELREDAPFTIDDFARRWRALAGTPEGAKKLDIKSGLGPDDNFKVELKSWDSETLSAAGQRFREALEKIPGVSGIDDNINTGEMELQFSLTPQAQTLGMTTADLSQQLLQAFGGEIVQRFQRGKDEVKVRVRYPSEDRRTIDDVLQSHVYTPDGVVVPLSLVAQAAPGIQQKEITRISGLPAAYVSASVDKQVISSNELVSQLEQSLTPELLDTYPDLQIHFAGEAEQQRETSGSMIKLFIIAMLAIYILLAVPLRSYIQPLIIMTAIPFGLVGAILGHWYNDMMLSILSFNGIVALSGVVVNDSLLLTARFNEIAKEAKGEPVFDAITTACTARLRPVLLTSLTTFAGLLPLLHETAPQAQFIIPAAVSLGYGILFATLITLLLVPSLLMIRNDLMELLPKSAKSSYQLT
ncbi:MAG: efflux RND transporter permease subunit [Chromatiales bacterium]|jgi:multidrug efflux pump subunit AcrB